METEEYFIRNQYLKRNGKDISSHLIRIANVEGIQNIFGFSKGIMELHEKESILIVYDNDASMELMELIDGLDIAKTQHYVIGKSEFEDSFSDQALHYCWNEYYEQNNWNCPGT